MDETAKQAKARAKAAKAEAKALRPFYKKKRWWVVGFVGFVAIAAAAGSGGTGTDSTSNGSSSNTVSSGLGSKDATADVVNLDCGSPDIIGVTYPEVTIRNNSSKASDYFITVVYESADGSIRYDSTTVMSMGLQPGQTTVEKGMIAADLPSGTICKVTEVQRTAS